MHYNASRGKKNATLIVYENAPSILIGV